MSHDENDARWEMGDESEESCGDGCLIVDDTKEILTSRLAVAVKCGRGGGGF